MNQIRKDFITFKKEQFQLLVQLAPFKYLQSQLIDVQTTVLFMCATVFNIASEFNVKQHC